MLCGGGGERRLTKDPQAARIWRHTA